VISKTEPTAGLARNHYILGRAMSPQTDAQIHALAALLVGR
jgi:hypothetical protein